MNEPYQRVSSQGDHNSTIGTIATHIGLGLGTSALAEGGTVLGAKKLNAKKHPVAKEFLNKLAYMEGEGDNRFMRAASSGIATKPGRLLNYGAAVAGGLLTGAISSSTQNKN